MKAFQYNQTTLKATAFCTFLSEGTALDFVSHISQGQGLCLLKQVSAFDKYSH